MESAASIRATRERQETGDGAVQEVVRQLGGAIHHQWTTLGDFNSVLVAELPGDTAANALWTVLKASDGVAQVRIESVLTLDEHVKALWQAKEIDYVPPQGQTWDRNAERTIPEIDRGPVTEFRKGDLYLVNLLDCNPASIRAMVQAPHDRRPAVAATVEQLGGKLHEAWMTLTEYDAFMIVELPDPVAASALWTVLKAGEGVVRVSMQTVITADDHAAALTRSSSVKYTPPQGNADSSEAAEQGRPSKEG